MKPKAVVLLSGGLDSATVAASAIRDGFEVCALSFEYGQRHSVELEAARRVVDALGIAEHKIIPIDLRAFGGSALTDDIEVPKDRSDESMDETIPVTYVPARNTIFLSFALAWAEILEALDIFIGVSSVDYSGYPDCRPEYISAFQDMARLATKAGVEGHGVTIRAPLMELTKAQTVRLGVSLGVDYAITVSCYEADNEGRACGHCDSCLLRSRGFREADMADSTNYQSSAVTP